MTLAQPIIPAPRRRDIMTHTLNNLRLVKLQVATKQHECAECVDPIEEGERYMRAALPPTVEAFPDPEAVAQEDAWQHVDKTWTIEKTHELCYSKRYFRPVALRNDDFVGGKPLSVDIPWGRDA